MNDKIRAAHNFRIGPDFELHTLKKKDLEKKMKESLKGLQGEEGEAFQCKKKQGAVDREHNLQAVRYMNVGFYLVTPLVVGVLLGSYIDRVYGIRPVATISLIMVGSVAMFYNLYRLTKKH